MKILLTVIALMVTITANAGTAFFKYEVVQGMTKLCVYDYIGSIHSITVKSYQLCPITIQVN